MRWVLLSGLLSPEGVTKIPYITWPQQASAGPEAARTPTAYLSTAGSLDRLWTVTVDTGAPADRAAHCFADWRTLRELLADRYDQTLAAVGIAAGNADSRAPNSSYGVLGRCRYSEDMAESGPDGSPWHRVRRRRSVCDMLMNHRQLSPRPTVLRQKPIA